MNGYIENGWMVLAEGQGGQIEYYLRGREKHPLYQPAIAIAKDLRLGDKAINKYGYVTIENIVTKNSSKDHVTDAGLNSYLSVVYSLMSAWDIHEKLVKDEKVAPCETLGRWDYIRRDGEHEGKPAIQVAGGVSVGEIVAMVIGGMISAQDGLRLAATRGVKMQEACELNRNKGLEGGMWVITGKTQEEIKELLSPYGNDVSIGNSNVVGAKPASNKYVITGLKAVVEEVRQKVLHNPQSENNPLLDVDGAYHSRFMYPANEAIEGVLTTLNQKGDIHESNMIVLDHLGRPQHVMASKDPEGIVQRFSDQVRCPIEPHLVVKAATYIGVKRAIVLGPSGTSAAILRGNGMTRTQIRHIQTPEDVAALDIDEMNQSGGFSLKDTLLEIKRAWKEKFTHQGR